VLDLALVLLLAYLLVLWAGGWVLEFLARVISIGQTLRAPGFAYDSELDRLRVARRGSCSPCTPSTTGTSLAIYKAPASSCNECVLKSFCTPHDEGRHVYRTLAEFHETDVGRFHRCSRC